MYLLCLGQLMDINSPFLPLTSSAIKYQTNEPFNKISEKQHIDSSKDYVLSFDCETNPISFDLTDKFSSISSMEVLKSRIERSENTCESYRNCPFITLFNDYANVLLNADTSDTFMKETGFSNMNASEVLSFLNASPYTRTPCSRTFNYNYSISSLHTMWWQSPGYDWGHEYDGNWYLSSLWKSFELRIAPFVLDTLNYTTTTLSDALNNISNAYYFQLGSQLPSVTTKYNSILNRFYFESYSPFILLPSNAYAVVGLRPDMIYISMYDLALSSFYVWADHPPKLEGPDVIYLQNEESMYSYRNSKYSVLHTIYLPDTGLYPYMNMNNITYTGRPIQMMSNNVNKLTFSLYSDLSKKLLYKMNGKKWNFEVIIHGICN